MDSRNIIVWTLAGLGILIVLGYSFFALKNVIRGPSIEIRTPQSGHATTTPLITISGRAIRGNLLFINGATTTIDLAGNFKEVLLLSQGYNIMTIEARDRYGRKAEEKIEMVLTTTERRDATSTAETETAATSTEALTD